ncbi:beta-N-acetylhexosaminidase [bacterium]|nr:beta-N-acetylhexosaminidase [bacterium]
MINAAIYGCSGLRLTADEKAFFADSKPYGFILFARNCEEPSQLRALVNELREVSYDQAPILIDQEGGRVARLRPPHWRPYRPAGDFAKLYKVDAEAAREAVYHNGRLIAEELAALGITVDCVPLLDVPSPGSHDIIGDRAFGDTPEQVADLAAVMCKAMMDGGVLPVIKHIPGHGRAMADSHLELPVVDASLAELEAVDVPPFKALKHMPYGMTAHVLYKALDAEEVGTFSRKVIGYIREVIGFDGLLMSDDLSMKALAGDFASRVTRSMDAGCDLVLHCNGDMSEMKAVAGAVGSLSPTAMVRHLRAMQLLKPAAKLDCQQAQATVENLMQRMDTCSLA